MAENIIQIVKDEVQMVCPFRTAQTIKPSPLDPRVADQITLYPDCQGKACPWYDVDGKDAYHKCRQVIAVDINLCGGTTNAR